MQKDRNLSTKDYLLLILSALQCKALVQLSFRYIYNFSSDIIMYQNQLSGFTSSLNTKNVLTELYYSEVSLVHGNTPYCLNILIDKFNNKYARTCTFVHSIHIQGPVLVTKENRIIILYQD